MDINNPKIDPNQGLAKLQETPEKVELDEGCQADDGQATVAFFKIGRGGLPPTPEEPFSSETIFAPWIPLIFEGEKDLEQWSQVVIMPAESSTEKAVKIPCHNR